MPLGVHTSIAGGLHLSIERAASLGCDAMQIFGRNPRSWGFKPVAKTEVDLFRAKRKASGIRPVVIHTTYLINLCSPDEEIFYKSVDLFKNELRTADALEADYLVTHLGSSQDMGREYALKRIFTALKDVEKNGLGKNAAILLENTSGAGYGFGSRLTDLGEIIENAKGLGLKAGFCFDTCHAFAAGYEMGDAKKTDALINTIDKEAGLKNLHVIHLNDSKGGAGSNLDRHEHIGKGKIGIEPLTHFINHPEILPKPLILETPKKTEEDDPRNLSTVKEIRKKAS